MRTIKEKSINQINGLVQTNQTICFYKHLWTDAVRYDSKEWRHRRFKFMSHGREVGLTPAGNFIYAAAEKEFVRLTGKPSGYLNNSRSFNLEISNQFGDDYKFQISIQQSMYGITLECMSNFKPIEEATRYKSFLIRSKDTFSNIDIEKYFKNVFLKKYMYSEGLFRNIQLLYNCTKAEALERYKKRFSLRRPKVESDEYEKECVIMKAITKRIRKKLNIIAYDDFSPERLMIVLKTYNRRSKLTRMYKKPSLFDMSELYAMEYDTEDNIEGFVGDYFDENYHKNAIFI